jgi:creatinine amidohydrolase
MPNPRCIRAGSVSGVIEDTVSIGPRTSPEAGGHPLLLIPLGSTEQHGPHLPLDTDSRIAEAVARRAARECGAVVAPVLAYGASGEHAAFPGTLSIGTAALQHVLVELTRSARLSFESVVFINGHGGNHEAVQTAVGQLVDEGHRVASWSPKLLNERDAHAGQLETCVLLAIAPEVVHLELAERGNTTPIGELMPELRRGGVAAVSPNGVLGDPREASAPLGRAFLQIMNRDLTDFLRAL